MSQSIFYLFQSAICKLERVEGVFVVIFKVGQLET